MNSFDSLNLSLNSICAGTEIKFAMTDIDTARRMISENRDFTTILTYREIEFFNTCSSLKRKTEWLAGRLAAKEVLTDIFPCDSLSEIEIIRKDNGAPALACDMSRSISISHCGSFAVAVSAPFPIGIDLEAIEERPYALLEYFFHDKEIEFLKSAGIDALQRETNRLWTCKEAAVKAGGWGGTVNFKNINCSRNPVIIYNSTFYCTSGYTGTHVVTLATFEKSGNYHG